MPNNQPIGIFDSGLGGLTVAKEITNAMPYEPIYYVGDTGRCPYGPRPQSQVRDFVLQVGSWLERHGTKMIIIACNTATAAGLQALQEVSPVPVIGVIEPGARGAVAASKTKKIGVIATQGTVESQSYVKAIHSICPEAEVVQTPAGPFVTIVESELASGKYLNCDGVDVEDVFDTEEIQSIVDIQVRPLAQAGVDTVVLGCTHFPLLAKQIQRALGDDVVLVNPAYIATQEAEEMLEQMSAKADAKTEVLGVDGEPEYRFATTSSNVASFAAASQFTFGHKLDSVENIKTSDLEKLI